MGFSTSPCAPFYSLPSAQIMYQSCAQGPSLVPYFTYILTIMIYKDQCLLLPHPYTLACPLLDSSIALLTYLCLNPVGIISFLQAFLPWLFPLPRPLFLQCLRAWFPHCSQTMFRCHLSNDPTLTTLFKITNTSPSNLELELLYFLCGFNYCLAYCILSHLLCLLFFLS